MPKASPRELPLVVLQVSLPLYVVCFGLPCFRAIHGCRGESRSPAARHPNIVKPGSPETHMKAATDQNQGNAGTAVGHRPSGIQLRSEPRGTAAPEGAKHLECAVSWRFWMARGVASAKAPGYQHLTRVSAIYQLLRASLVNPARGDLFIELRTPKASQTPSGVTCQRAGGPCATQPRSRSPLTGFGSIITGAGSYKQVTPSGVAEQHAAERGIACKVQSGYGALQTLRATSRQRRPKCACSSIPQCSKRHAARPARGRCSVPCCYSSVTQFNYSCLCVSDL